MATDFVKNGKITNFVSLAFGNEMGYRYLNVHVNSANDACIWCENFLKFGLITPELTSLICERLVRHGQKRCIWSDISGSTGSIFAIFTTYESVLRADDGSVAYFPICQGTLPWQPNNVAKMLSTSTNTTYIRCTSARKRIAISWSSCAR